MDFLNPTGRKDRGAINVIIPPLWQILPWRHVEHFAPYGIRTET
jgi:hypothetical protein